MQAGKGYSLTLTKPAHSPKGCALLTEARVAVSPMNGKLRFGGTMELAGIGALLKLLEERKQRLAAEGLFDEQDPLAVVRKVGTLAEEGEPGDVRRQVLVGRRRRRAHADSGRARRLPAGTRA